MQMMGFAWMFVLFLVCAIAYKPLTQPSGIHWFQFLYFFSSFWGQFGPNATTWLLPGELFPTEARAMSHGLSAAVGKVRKEKKRKEKEKTTPFGVNLLISPVMYRAAQGQGDKHSHLSTVVSDLLYSQIKGGKLLANET